MPTQPAQNVRSCSATASGMQQCPGCCSSLAISFLVSLLLFSNGNTAGIDGTNNRDHHVTPVKHDSFELEALLLAHRSSGTEVNFPPGASCKFPSNTISNRLNGSRTFVCEVRCSGENNEEGHHYASSGGFFSNTAKLSNLPIQGNDRPCRWACAPKPNWQAGNSFPCPPRRVPMTRCMHQVHFCRGSS